MMNEWLWRTTRKSVMPSARARCTETVPSLAPAIQAEKSGYRHFMLKEIHEQPRAIEDTLLGRLSLDDWQVHLENLKMSAAQLKGFERAVIVAGGTSWHAGLEGKYMI